jgi:radical SAM superfamily enzyme YgiQ (UPF0313 family)
MRPVLLVNPPFSGWSFDLSALDLEPPIGVLLIGSCLVQAGVPVKVLDARLYRNYRDRIRQIIEEDEPVFVGLSVMTGQVGAALELAAMIKSLRSDLPVVWGGIHPTLFPEQTASDARVYVAVVGDGEDACLELTHAFNGDAKLESVKGIAFRRDSQVLVTPPRPPREIDSLPNLNFELLDVDKYILRDYSQWGGDKQTRTLTILTGKGCPCRCTFCINTIPQKRNCQFRSVPKILDEIAGLKDRYKITSVTFNDENFFGSKPRFFEFLKAIQERALRVTWRGNARANYFSDSYLSADRVKEMRTAGCVLVQIGAESGSQRILDYLKKDITLEQLVRCADFTGQARMAASFSFMMGIPGETPDEVNQTLRLARDLLKRNPLAYVIGPQVYRPYPGAELFDECVRLGLKMPRSLSEWPPVVAEGGHFSGFDLPWIEHPDFLRSVDFAARYAFRSEQPPGLKRIASISLKRLSTFRIQHNWWSCHAERRLCEWLRSAK